MYGFIYNTLRNLVIEKYGENEWIKICDEAGVDVMKEGILDRQYYDESYLKTIVAVASKRLDINLEDILESFGSYFFTTCKKSGHSSMLRTLGHHLYGFLMNLDSLHDHLSYTFTQMRAPSFRCEKTRSGLTLYYFSQRSGLGKIVIGIVKAVAKDFFQLGVIMEQVSHVETTDMLAHHYVFSIKVEESSKVGNYYERLTGEQNHAFSDVLPPLPDIEEEVTFESSQFNLKHSQVEARVCPMRNIIPSREISQNSLEEVPSGPAPLPNELANLIREQMQGLPLSDLPSFSLSRIHSRRGSVNPHDSDWPITPTFFQRCFPFHFIFDKELVIRFIGISFSRMLPKVVHNSSLVTDFFELRRPALEFNHKNIHSNLHNVFVIATKIASSDVNKEPLLFRGQMIPTPSHDILFLGSPRVRNPEDLKNQGLYLSDIPIHDVTRDLILLKRHFHVEKSTAAELEQTKKDLQIQKACVEREKQRADNLLHTMLPPSVANELKSGNEATAINYSAVTILFSDIKGFTTICNSCQPMQVVSMLNSLFTKFDRKSEEHEVYKVETIGDAYMVAGGLMDTSPNHAEAVTNMAFGMREEASKVMEPNDQKPLQIRIGIHTGQVVAGIVGQKMPRYCLFGDTVNTASRMESHGMPGRIHISEETYSYIKKKPYKFYSRGMINVKGLGQKKTYFVEPGDHIHARGDKISVISKSSVDTGDTISFTEYNQCCLVKPSAPASQHQFPFLEEGEDSNSGHQEQAWASSTSPKKRSEKTKSRTSPHEKKIVPFMSEDSNDGEPSTGKTSDLFISENNTDKETEGGEWKGRKRRRCVIS